MKTSKDNPVRVNFFLSSKGETSALIFAKISFGAAKRKYVVNPNKKTADDPYYALDKASVKYRPIKLSTQITIVRSFWKQKEQTSTNVTVNDQLTTFRENVILLYNNLKTSGIDITPERFKKEITTEILKHKAGEKNFHITVKQADDGKEKLVKKNLIPTIFTEYIDYKIIQWKKTSGKAAGTYKAYTTFKKWLIDFENSERKDQDKIDILIFDNKTAEDFFAWILKQKKYNKTKDKYEPYKLNFLTSLKTRLKVFLNEARNEDGLKLSTDLNLEKKIFKKKTEEVDDVYLTIDQLNRLKALKFKKPDERLEKIRDQFIVGCNCAYRYSDLLELRKLTYEQGVYSFHLQKSQKTKTRSRIPVMDEWVIDLYNKKYKGKFEFTEYEQKFNKLIKKVCKMAGLTDEVDQVYINPTTQKNYTVSQPLYKMVSSRSMRKTAASNWVRYYHQPISVAKEWTGHESENSFKSYIRLSQEEYYQISVEHMKMFKLMQSQQHRLKKAS